MKKFNLKPHRPNLFLFSSLLFFLVIFSSGCGTMVIKRVNPDNPNAIENNERIVFGRIIFSTHSEQMGDVSFPPLGLGLVHTEAEKHARQDASSHVLWFENDGTFYWILPVGIYHIDALAWGFKRNKFRLAPDPKKPRPEETFSLRPEDPPECGFVVNPHMIFNVAGNSGAIYIGSLLIDMDIKKKDGIGSMEAIKINRIEIKDEYAEAVALLKSRFSSCTLAVEKTLMTSTPDTVSAANGDCPSRASNEDLLRFLFFLTLFLHH